ncbi:uncharacterized protein K452DRAFT_326109 [Aplosporella prunicola CBS 121167]|uniref:Uncharacterized protein n=1 Tax=Aplosporella prunicola CBS 121167 TaxID=1176127 RepID=A0A6A6BHZ3_9PEZI|nr:uncharacterized protein K452DRAFT_326109 [Aplosporella prunicola CBS 121167]KAF2142874.1 hypothetical protein K452DRAFT_326109 [Aplosporella prunicola CBS 121167]
MINNVYLFYSVTIFVLLAATLAYLTRHHWLHALPNNPFARWFYTRLPSSFAADIESGFSSAHFDLAGNVADGDSRAGLDDVAKAEIRKIMKARRVGFDEARRIFTEARFARNGIGPDGRPRDPKFVSFS